MKGTNKTDPSMIIKWLREMGNLIKEQGFFNIIKSLILIIISFITFYLLFNPEKIFEMYNTYCLKQHNAAIEYRLKIDPKIRQIIRELRIESNASRTFVLEAHNGQSNLNGLPFLYLDMKYEEYIESDGVIGSISDEYKNLSVSRFSFINTLYKSGYWIGSIDELMNIDKRLAQRMASNGASYLAIISLQGVNAPLGFLGLTYGENMQPESIHTLSKLLHSNAQRVTSLLDDYNKK